MVQGLGVAQGHRRISTLATVYAQLRTRRLASFVEAPVSTGHAVGT
jgi:hypothetical protein